MGDYFVSSPDRTVSLSFRSFTLLFCYSVDLLNINMDTYHAAHWSDLDYSSSEDEENRYRSKIQAVHSVM